MTIISCSSNVKYPEENKGAGPVSGKMHPLLQVNFVERRALMLKITL
jgi:hypothetical protein